MNVSRTNLTQYVSQTVSQLRNSASEKVSEFTHKVCTERAQDVAEFSHKLESTPGADSAEIVASSQQRGITRMLLSSLSGVGLGAAVVAGTLAVGGAAVVVGIAAASCLAVAGIVGAATMADKESGFRDTVGAFSRDLEAGHAPGVTSGLTKGARADSGTDDDWLINPANPASPLSLVNPASPFHL